MPRHAALAVLVALAACGGDGRSIRETCAAYCDTTGGFGGCDPAGVTWDCVGDCTCEARCVARTQPDCRDEFEDWMACDDEQACDWERCRDEAGALMACYQLDLPEYAPAVATCTTYCALAGGAGTACDILSDGGDECLANCVVPGYEHESPPGLYCLDELDAWNACADAEGGACDQAVRDACAVEAEDVEYCTSGLAS
jgi:hypothetical protein